MLQYAQDAAETNTPWERWQTKDTDSENWRNIFNHPNWFEHYEYRRKPSFIVINGIEVPEPMREKLEIGDIYYVPHVTYKIAEKLKWTGNMIDIFNLNNGLVHLTESDAFTHSYALLSLTQKEETK